MWINIVGIFLLIIFRYELTRVRGERERKKKKKKKKKDRREMRNLSR